MVHLASFWKNLKFAVKQCYQTVHFQLVKNWWKMPKFKTWNATFLGNFKHYAHIAIDFWSCTSSLIQIGNAVHNAHKTDAALKCCFSHTCSEWLRITWRSSVVVSTILWFCILFPSHFSFWLQYLPSYSRVRLLDFSCLRPNLTYVLTTYRSTV